MEDAVGMSDNDVGMLDDAVGVFDTNFGVPDDELSGLDFDVDDNRRHFGDDALELEEGLLDAEIVEGELVESFLGR